MSVRMSKVMETRVEGNGSVVREVTERRRRRRVRGAGLLGLALAGVLSLSPAATLADQLLSDGGGSPARGTAQVVAQTVVDLGDGPVAWRIADGEVDAAGDAFAAPSDGFLIGADGVLLMTDAASGGRQRIAGGEAIALRDGAEYGQQALGQDDAGFFWIGLGEDGPGDLFRGNAFDEMGGLRDVDLLRDTLRADAETKLPAGEGPTLVLATAGEIEVLIGGDQVVTLRAGEAVEAGGAVQIVASDHGTASYVAAIIGGRLDRDEPATPTGGASSDGGTTGSVPEAVVDSDGDGLTDQLEGQIGTDPAIPDTDQDGLADGDEYENYGSDPLSMDGDGDGLPDYNEVMQQSTNPADPDTDHDGVSDHNELSLGTLPLDPDTDDDDLSDGYEVDNGSNVLDSDTDDDTLLDGDEVHLYGSSPTSLDTDGDGLPDLNEVMQQGTSPALADTDADNINDHDELSYGTSLLNPDSDGDGALDGDEIFGGTDPLDPASTP